MKQFFVTFRIALCLVGLSISGLLAAHLLGFVPDNRPAIMEGRSRLCEAIAVSYSLMAERDDVAAMEAGLQAIKERNNDILSIAVRRTDRTCVIEVGKHAAHWEETSQGKSTETHLHVPISSNNEPWGSVEMRFRPVAASGPLGISCNPLLVLAGFLAICGLFTHFLFLRRVLNQLNPSRVVPARVKAALDSLAEGLLVLDNDGRIVLANRAFGKTVQRSPEQLTGQKPSKLPWKLGAAGEASGEPMDESNQPWTQVLTDGVPRTGTLLELQPNGSDRQTFVVNATPIQDNTGSRRGVLASFEDVTPLERKKAELGQTLEELQQSTDEVRRQNRELEMLATRDPLTSCLNRRAFFDHFENHWKSAWRYEHPLSCVMIDIDHFKQVNDTHGHRTGDRVLKQVATAMQDAARDVDIICRYGGEEFAVLLPHVDVDGAALAAERLRTAISEATRGDVHVTASLGVSALSQGARDSQDMLEQADKCLYVAKRNGRNQVICWDQVPPDLEVDKSELSSANAGPDLGTGESIPFHAVTALISALAYRDLHTAEHSRRVADLCVAAANNLLSLSDCYVLETAALLHDIGKVGVPDSILLKAGPLTREEWEVMRKHDRIGVEIVRASFNNEKLTAILANHSAFYEGREDQPGLPRGNRIPLAARILAIADAYDSMVTDHVYRPGRTPEEAVAELRRCAGSQFDPELVESFIDCVSEQNPRRKPRSGNVAKGAALEIGRQIEGLVAALDQRDEPSLKALAGRLKTSAKREGVGEIAQKSAQLEVALNDGDNLLGVLHVANELVELCRSVQTQYLQGVSEGVQ